MNGKCRAQIYSEKYQDYLVEHVEDGERISRWYGVDCFQIASERFAVVYQQGNEVQFDNQSGILVVPYCYGLMSSTEVLEASGITRVQSQPGLSLYGQGVMVGFIDTGAGVRNKKN